MMHIKSLHINSFGHFEDKAIHGLEPGLVVIYGPNEAGKSTLRQAIRWVLFGPQRGDKQRWEGRSGNIDVAVVLGGVGVAQETLQIHRAKSRVDARMGQRPLPGDAAVHLALGGTDLAMFDAILSFDSMELQQIASLKGERLQALLAVGAVAGKGSHPSDIITVFDKEAQALWRPRADCIIQTIHAALKDGQGRLADAQREAEAYAPLLAEAEGLKAQIAALSRALDAQRDRARQTTLIVEAWPQALKREELLGAADLPELLPLTPADALEVETALTQLRRARAAHDEAENARAEASARAEAVRVDETIIAETPAIRALVLEEARLNGSTVPTEDLIAAVETARGNWTEAQRALAGAIDLPALSTIDCGPAVLGEARQHATVTARLLAEAGPALARAVSHADAVEAEARAIAEALAQVAPSPFEAKLRDARAYLAESQTHLDIDRRRDERARALKRLEEAPPERPRRLAPVLAEEALEALESFGHDWAVAAAKREATLSAASEAARRAQAAVAEAEEAARAIEADNKQERGSGQTDVDALLRLEASGGRAKELVGRIAALASEARTHESAMAEAKAAVGLAPDSSTLEHIDHSAPARHRVRRAFEGLGQAQKRLDTARARRPSGPSDRSGPAPTLAEATARRESLVRARSAVDVYHQALGRGDSARGSDARPRTVWLSVACFLVLAIIAFVMATVIVGALAVIGALAVYLTSKNSAPAGPAEGSDRDSASQAVQQALRAAALSAEATRADVEVAIVAADDAVIAARSRAQSAETIETLNQELAAAQEATHQGAALAKEALRSCNIDVDADADLAEAYFEAATDYHRAATQLARVKVEGAEVQAQWRVLSAALSEVIPTHEAPEDLGATLAALGSLRARCLSQNAQGDAARTRVINAQAALAAATKDLELARAAPAVRPDLAAAWTAWAAVHGVGGGAPGGGLTKDLKQARVWALFQDDVAATRAARDGLDLQLKSFEAQLNDLLRGLTDDDDVRLAVRIENLREYVDSTMKQATRRQDLLRQEADVAARLVVAKHQRASAETTKDDADDADRAFRAFATLVRAPEGTPPAEIEAWVGAIITAQTAQRAATEAETLYAARAEAVAAFVTKARTLAASLGLPEVVDSVEAATAIAETSRTKLEAANEAKMRRSEREELLRELTLLTKTREDAHRAAAETLDHAFAAIGCPDETAWQAHLTAAAAASEAKREVALIEAGLRGSLGVDWHERLTAAMDELPERALWVQRGHALAEAIEAANAERLDHEQTLAEIKLKLRGLETSLDVIERASEVADLELELTAANERYWRNRLARRLLSDTFERFRKTRQPAVIKEASGWLAEATDGAYTALETDDDSAMSFVVVASDGRRHKADTLSTGTTALVYLCLRLALALDQGRDGAALPIIADDVLAHFDAERSAGAARLLKRVAAEAGVQLIVFTCRPETVATITTVAPDAQRVDLPRWAGLLLPAPRRGTTATQTATMFDKAR